MSGKEIKIPIKLFEERNNDDKEEDISGNGDSGLSFKILTNRVVNGEKLSINISSIVSVIVFTSSKYYHKYDTRNVYRKFFAIDDTIGEYFE